MGWWTGANEAEDPDRLVRELRAIGRGVRKLGRAVRDEVRESRQRRRDRPVG